MVKVQPKLYHKQITTFLQMPRKQNSLIQSSPKYGQNKKTCRTMAYVACLSFLCAASIPRKEAEGKSPSQVLGAWGDQAAPVDQEGWDPAILH